MCEEWFDETIDNFYMLNKSYPEKGFTGMCKSCSIEKVKARNLSNYDKYIERVHKRYREHKNTDLKRKQEWYQNNKDYCRDYTHEYFENNKEKFPTYNKTRSNKNHKISKQEWNACKKYFDNSCAYCGLHENEHYGTYRGIVKLHSLHREHVEHDGLCDLSNCIPSCNSCNSKKWLYPMEEWYRQQEYFSESKLNKIHKWLNEDYKQYIKQTG